MAARVAVDIGRTFTDLITLDEETGAVGVAKTSTTPGRFEDGVMEAIGRDELDGVSFLAHGTTVIITVIINALTERTGARTALITTRGFRDVLEIQKANRPDLYDLLYSKQQGGRTAGGGRSAAPWCGVGGDPLPAYVLCVKSGPSIVREEWPEVPVASSPELSSEWRE